MRWLQAHVLAVSFEDYSRIIFIIACKVCNVTQVSELAKSIGIGIGIGFLSCIGIGIGIGFTT